jgi:hypothetical protein
VERDKDLQLYEKAANAGFQLVVTDDAKQLNRKPEVEAIAKSGLHRVRTPTVRTDSWD